MKETGTMPTVGQASRIYLLLLALLLAGSALLAPRLGLGGNLWVNELGYILLPPIWMAWRGKWQWRQVFRLKSVSVGLFLTCLLVGALLWFPSAALFSALEVWANHAIGALPIVDVQAMVSPSQGILFLLGVVVLAPLCEELFFRGFLQRAYEAHGGRAGWIVAGVLFGAMHVLNGMNNWVPATLLGLALGYAAYRTGSLWCSVAMHAGNNLMSRWGVLLLPQLFTGSGAPLWMYGLALVAGLGGWGLLLRVGRSQPSPTQIPRSATSPLMRSLSLWLAALLLLATAGTEIALRAGWLNALFPQTQPESVIRAGEFEGVLPVLRMGVTATDLGQHLVFRYHLSASDIDAVLELQDPGGVVIWEQEWRGSSLTVQSGDLGIDLDQAGDWQLFLRGRGQGLELTAYWRVQP